MVKKIGIDLGTTNLLICVDNEGVIVNEPSVITVDLDSQKCIAAGTQAKAMVGKTPGKLKTIYPLKDGVVADYEATDMMLAHFFKKCELKKMFSRNEILICCPTNITGVERNAIRDCAYHKKNDEQIFNSVNKILNVMNEKFNEKKKPMNIFLVCRTTFEFL